MLERKTPEAERQLETWIEFLQLFEAKIAAKNIIEGGEGLANDSITANDGVRQYPVRLLDGDITPHNPKQ